MCATKWEPYCKKDVIKRVPTNGVEGFAEVKLEDGCTDIPFMAGLNNVSNIEKVLSNGTTFDEPSLIKVKRERDKLAEAKSKTFGVDLETVVSEGYRPKIILDGWRHLSLVVEQYRICLWVKAQGQGSGNP
jgi:hypothetical protein